MASLRRTIGRAMSRDSSLWRRVAYKHGENRVERRLRSKKTREQEKKNRK